MLLLRCVQYSVGSNLLDRTTRHEANVSGITHSCEKIATKWEKESGE